MSTEFEEDIYMLIPLIKVYRPDAANGQAAFQTGRTLSLAALPHAGKRGQSAE